MNLEGIGKIYNVGDTHLGIRSNSVEWFNIQNEYLTGHFLQQVDESGFNEETDILIQYGDWFHNRESTNNRIWNGSLEVLEKLCNKFKRGVYIFLGNHDVYYKDSNKIHSLAGLSKIFPNLHIIEDPTVFTINGKHRVLILPWIDDVNKITRVIGSHIGKAEYIMCHADFQNMQLNKYAKIEHGIDLDVIREFKKVYSGHIHIRQEFKNALYIGTPYEMDRGDRGNTKGFYIMDATQDSLNEEFIPNEFSPKFVKYFVKDILEMNKDQIKDLFSNNFVDLMLKMENASSFPVTQFIEMVKDFGHRTIEFFTFTDEAQRNKELAEITEEAREYDLMEVFEECLKAKQYPERIENPMRIYFNKVYNKVKNKDKDYE